MDGLNFPEHDVFLPFIVRHSLLQTDSLLTKSNFTYQSFAYWYSNSWFSKGEFEGKIVSEDEYITPPLDGVWATAHYLYNGFVSNMEAMLSSEKRSVY